MSFGDTEEDPATEPGAETMATATHGRLRNDIIAGVFRPGQKLLLRELRARYGVGVAPVREALNRLTSEALVVQADQRGFRVSGVSLSHLDDLVDARCLLEGICLRDSVTGNDSAWREALRAAYRRMAALEDRARAGEADYQSWERAHGAFHLALISGGRSLILRGLCVQLRTVAVRYRHLGRLPGPGREPEREAEHLQILDAALAGDADHAAGLLDAHYRVTGRLVREEMLRSLE
jgi:DNA-binding GntR family transcriptional regulator